MIELFYWAVLVVSLLCVIAGATAKAPFLLIGFVTLAWAFTKVLDNK